MVKRIVSFALAILTAFCTVAVTYAQTADYVSDFEVLHLQRKGEPSFSGLTDYITVDENGKPVEISDGYTELTLNTNSANLPASYDARKDGIKTKVRNQGNFGTCWAIAVSSVMESYAYKHGLAPADSINFSETHLAYFGNNSLVTDSADPTSGDGQISENPWNEGGNIFKASAALARWSGIADGKDFPAASLTSTAYKLNEKDRYNSNTSFLLESYDILSLDNRAEVKEWIFENGAATLSYSHNDNYLKFANGSYSYYADTDTMEYHAVTVIGWNDNYSSLNFKITPPGNGAWLCKNSWGSSWSNEGYFWISYYDTTIYRFSGIKIMPKSNLVTLEAQNKYEYPNLNNYTYNGAPYFSMLTADESISAANVFTAKTTERLSAVSTYTNQGNVYATVSVYKNLNDSYKTPVSGILAAKPQTFFIENEGYHTLELSDFITLTQGENFAVVIDYTAKEAQIALPVEYDTNEENYVYASLPGQSYVNTGSGWLDLTVKGYDNVYIQAFTDSISALPDSGTKIALGSYPQTLVTDEELLSSLNSLDLEWNYFSNSGNGSSNAINYMNYADVEFQSKKYRAVKIINYRPYYSENSSTKDNSYQDENGYYPNRTYWFEYKPLIWSVFNREEGILLCDSVIDSQPFSNSIYLFDSNGDSLVDKNEYYNNKEHTVKLNDYETSSVREWLNNDFYLNTFTDEEKSILDIRLNSNTPRNSQSEYADTLDNVFLLSYEEISDSTLPINFVNGFRIVSSATDYAKCLGIKTFIGSSSVYWWLRTAYESSAYNCTVSYNGRIGSPNQIWSSATCYGIRPAIKINLEHNYHTATWYCGDEAQKVSLHYGDILTSPDPQAPEGYSFKNWSPEIPHYMPDEDVYFIAEWTPNSYEVCFNAMGGSWGEETTQTVLSTYAENIILPKKPIKKGYVFAGWADSSGNPPEKLTSTQPLTYFALWSPSDNNSYTVKTYLMDTSGKYKLSETERVTAPTEAEIKINPTPQKGFTVNKTFSTLSGTVLPQGNASFDVYYDRNKYRLNINSNGSTEEQLLYYEETVKIKSPERTGYTFIGWDKAIPETMPDENLTVTARWAINQYTLSLDTDGGTVLKPIELNYGAEIPKLPEPSKQGYRFLGWSPEVPETMPAENLTVHAVFGIAANLKLRQPSVDTIKYGDTLVLHTETSELPDNVHFKWNASNDCVTVIPDENGRNCRITPSKSGNTVITVTLINEKGQEIMDENGNVKSVSVNITSKTGFFWKIISFFKNLFNSERVIDA